MTPQERDLITELFERMRRQGLAEIDNEAAELIARAMRADPNAGYQLVQSVIVQNMALERAEQRIRDLEDDLREIESEDERGRGRSSGGSFLGGLFGGGRRDDDRDDYDDRDDDRRRRSSSRDDDDYDRRRDYRDERPVSGRTAGSTSVPPAGGFGSRPAQSGGASPWSTTPPATTPAPARSGGSFLGTALTTATGVAGGMLLADGIRGLFQGDNPVAGATEAAKSAGSSIFGEPKAAEPGVTEASDTTSGADSGGGGLFDSLFGGGDDSGDDSMDI